MSSSRHLCYNFFKCFFRTFAVVALTEKMTSFSYEKAWRKKNFMLPHMNKIYSVLTYHLFNSINISPVTLLFFYRWYFGIGIWNNGTSPITRSVCYEFNYSLMNLSEHRLLCKLLDLSMDVFVTEVALVLSSSTYLCSSD